MCCTHLSPIIFFAIFAIQDHYSGGIIFYIIRFLLALKVPTHCLKGETFIIYSKKINKKVLKIFGSMKYNHYLCISFFSG
jgi:hypothetical protein